MNVRLSAITGTEVGTTSENPSQVPSRTAELDSDRAKLREILDNAIQTGDKKNTN